MIGTVAAFIADTRPPRAVLDITADCLLDTLGVMLAGSAHPDVRALEASLSPYASSQNTAGALWSNRAFRRDDAALLYGMAAHVLDYDDVSMLAICHPSVPMVAALAASSFGRGVTGPRLLAAYAIGTEVMIRLGEVMGPGHYALGFHATATLGMVGAAAALAHLAGLDATGARHAINIAASMAGGLQANFGSAVKSLHVGFAASAAVRALTLTQGGLTAADDAFARRGFFHAFSGGKVDLWPKQLALGAPFAIEAPGFEQKRFPCCYMLHRLIAGTLALRERHGLSLADVRAVEARYPTGGTAPLRYDRPATGMQALFSAPYACISALADGKVDLATFTDEAVARDEIRARLADVRVTETDELSRPAGLSASPVEVCLTLRDGRVMHERVEHAPGSRDDPLSPAQAEAKWLDCLRRANPGLNDARALEIRRAGATLAKGAVGVDTWLAQLRNVVRPRIND